MKKIFGALAAGLGLVGTLIFAPGAALAASIPVPDQDPWYTPPAGYEALPNGGFIRDRAVTSGNFQELAGSVWQVLYKSTDSHGQPTTGVVTIVVPKQAWTGRGLRPVVAYTEAEDALTTSCAPSYTLRAGTNYEAGIGVLALELGYALIYPDYEGPRSLWIDGRQAAQSTLDGIRAALHYAPAGLSPGAPVGVMGYSGGGGASGWTASLKQSYAPELNLVGAAVGAASNGDITQVWDRNDGALSVGLLVMAINGLSKAFPEAGIDSYLTAEGNSLVASADNACIYSVADWAVAGRLEKYTVTPSVPVPQSAPGSYIFSKNSLVEQSIAPSMPVQVFNDQWDELVPAQATVNEAKHWCALGSQVQVILTVTPTPAVAAVHVAGVAEWTLPALSFLSKRFENEATPNDCPKEDIWGSAALLALKLPYADLSP